MVMMGFRYSVLKRSLFNISLQQQSQYFVLKYRMDSVTTKVNEKAESASSVTTKVNEKAESVSSDLLKILKLVAMLLIFGYIFFILWDRRKGMKNVFLTMKGLFFFK